jgi:hypothetical protein
VPTKHWKFIRHYYEKEMKKELSDGSTRRAGGLRWPPKGGLKYKISFISFYLCQFQCNVLREKN